VKICNASVYGISFFFSHGGHKIMLPSWQRTSRIQVCSLDITMLAAEMDIPKIPIGHPDATSFVRGCPFCGEKFDFVLCDDQALRRRRRLEYRERREAWSLLTSQIVLALQHIKKGGKLVVPLDELDTWNTILLLLTLTKSLSLQLFKPKKKHAMRSSFYVVADQMQPQNPYFRAAVAKLTDQTKLLHCSPQYWEYSAGR
jgi:hypothetical protein